MSLHQLFCNNPAIADETAMPFKLKIDPADRNHLRALRLEVGEHLAVIDAQNDYFEVEIERIEEGELWVSIAAHLDAPAKTTPVMLVQGFAKGEKMDTVLRGATELGIAGFFPAIMQRTIVRLDQKKATKRHERFCQIARSASLQAGRTQIPEVAPIQPLKEIVASWSDEDTVLLFWEEADLEQTVRSRFGLLEETDQLEQSARFWVVIGPEGGISPDEVALIEQSTARVFTCSLGPTILRTETAGVVASALTLSELRERCEMDPR